MILIIIYNHIIIIYKNPSDDHAPKCDCPLPAHTENNLSVFRFEDIADQCCVSTTYDDLLLFCSTMKTMTMITMITMMIHDDHDDDDYEHDDNDDQCHISFTYGNLLLFGSLYSSMVIMMMIQQ